MKDIQGSAVEVWKRALLHIMDQGEEFQDHGNRTCQETLRLDLELTSFDDIEKPIFTLSQFPQWMYPKPQEIQEMILEGKLSSSYAYSYGERIFAYKKTKQNVNNTEQHNNITSKNSKDQINEFIIPLLQQDPNSRRAVISLWDPFKDTMLTKKTVPGLVLIDCKIRNGKLYIMSIIRSCDIFIGLPANMYQLFVLARYIAKKLDVDIGSISITATSAHIFIDQIPDIKTVL
jgi:thymidylate synthase